METIGLRLGFWSREGKHLGFLLGQDAKVAEWNKIAIDVLKPQFFLDSEMARLINDVPSSLRDEKIFAVGTGALGSQLIINLLRAAVGRWKIADADLVFPHNVTRSNYFSYQALKAKVFALTELADAIIPGFVTPLYEDIITGKNEIGIQEAVQEAGLILDISASSAALKALADYKRKGKICSVFTNPSGTDTVFLAEDKAQAVDITALEVQYLCFILQTPALHDHLSTTGQKLRYGNGCRDISLVLPQDSIAFSAAIASKQVKKLLVSDEPLIKIWRMNQDTLDVQTFDVPVAAVYKQEFACGWEVIYNANVLEHINRARKNRLPKETGGILLGTFDMVRRKIFIADTIDSPPDSEEYPTAYIRGIAGIGKQLNQIAAITDGTIRYVGEWHTHPDGYETAMSEDDKVLFAWLRGHMAVEGLPALMLIAGERGYGIFVDNPPLNF